MNILINVSGSGASIGEVTKGQVDCGAFAHENVPGNSLRNLIHKYWGHPNTIIVQDSEFGSGYHRVTTACGAGGCSWSYRLHLVVSDAEAIDLHDFMVQQAMAQLPVTGKSGLEVAFERAIDIENATI